MAASKLEQLRKLMNNKQIDAYIIPSTDPHQSEYMADYWKSRQWLTGFTGSAGVAVVTKREAGLWTDSRYFIQAGNQLKSPFILHKQITRTPEYMDWLFETLNFGETIGFDGRLFSAAFIEKYTPLFSQKQIKLQSAGDLFVGIWTDRPTLPVEPVINHDIKYCGKSRVEKINEVKTYLKLKEADNLLISTLDDIAWLLNIRGNDIKYNPVVTSFCLINSTGVYLFMDEHKLNDQTRAALIADKINIRPYDEVYEYLKSIKDYRSILLDAATINSDLYHAIPPHCKIVNDRSIVSKYKAIKNKVELENYRKTQVRDGIALCRTLQWVENEINRSQVTELDVAAKAEQFRSKQPDFMGLSFETISAYGSNAALPHYAPSKNSDAHLLPESMYLIDSGGQYLGGTTDITRTIALGPVTKEQKTDFTLVLKGHINLARTKFPSGTRGYQLDPIARLGLWQQGKDYGHGTGHGIGFYLNVHEGPQGFATSADGPASRIIEPGMLITNEPGVYFEGQYGIRTENVLLCKEAEKTELGQFLEFETVSYCPIDTTLVDQTLLTRDELDWLNSYHQQVFNLLSPHIEEYLRNWLQEKTTPIK